jgi:F-type H+-transporting ATPase subunit a
VVSHKLHTFHVGSLELEFSNHMLMALVAGVLMLVFFPLAARQRTMVPRGVRNLVEMICEFIRESVARPQLGENTDRFIKYLWTTFFFILFCNLLGMIPLDGIIYLLTHKKHLGGTATANIWVTGSLALFAFIMIHVSGIRQQGLVSYIKNFTPHVPKPMWPFIFILEIIGALVKPFALAIRLFANMLAGHTVLGALIGLALMPKSYTIAGVTVLGASALSLLELFVAFLQAYIFTFLTAVFISAAVHPEH